MAEFIRLGSTVFNVEDIASVTFQSDGSTALWLRGAEEPNLYYGDHAGALAWFFDAGPRAYDILAGYKAERDRTAKRYATCGMHYFSYQGTPSDRCVHCGMPKPAEKPSVAEIDSACDCAALVDQALEVAP